MDLRSGILSTANSLGMDPNWLAAIISYETAGTFDPTKAGPTTQWGQHRGLIQFGEPQAQQYGVDWNNPIGSQLGPDGAVAKYFRDRGWQPGMSLEQAYSIVNAGAPNRLNASDANNGGAPGTVAEKVRNQFAPHMAKGAALLGGEGNDTLQARASTQGAPMGLFDSFTSPEEPQRFGDRLRAAASDGSLWDGLALAANSLSHRPDPQLAAMVSQRQQGREDAKRKNRTVEWMRANGMGDLAGAVESGALSAQQAIAMVMQRPEDNRTALMQNYEYALSQGMSPEEARQWVSGGTNVNVNTGPTGTDYGKPEAGLVWQRDENGNIVLDERGAPVALPYQGGSAWREGQEAEAKAVAADTARALGSENTQSRAGVVLSNIDAVRNKVDNSILPVTGAIGSLVKQIPGTNAYDVSALTTTIRANIGFDRLQQMRDESPTGGALGQVAVQELEALQASLGNLDQAQSEEQFLAALDAVEKQYTEIMRKASQYPNAADYGFATLPPASNGGISSDPLGIRQPIGGAQ